jgi:hypothetical protein
MSYGDGFYKQTPSNILLDNSSPLFDNIVDNKVDLYVSTTGDDTNGDGSESNPYATPQRAVDSIPQDVTKDIYIKIRCGSGTFRFPNVVNIPPSISVIIVGDTTNPFFSLPVGATTFSPVAGKKARLSGNIGSYGDTITNGSHWMLIDYSAFNFPDSAAVVAQSTSPNLEYIGQFDYNSFAPVSVYEYGTIFEINAFAGSPSFSYSEKTSNSSFAGVSLLGIDIRGNSVNPVLKGIHLSGCKFSSAPTSAYYNPLIRDARFSIYAGSDVTSVGTEGESQLDGSYLECSLSIRVNEGPAYINGSVINGIYCGGSGFASLYYVDFEGTGVNSGICIVPNVNSYLTISDITVESSKSALIGGGGTMNSYFEFQGPVVGSVTGNAIVLARGSQAFGVKTNCNSTLTAGGSEIVVGGNTGQTFSSLPANDIGSANPQFCRAE